MALQRPSEILDTRTLPIDVIANAYEDFRVFLWIVWQSIGLPAPTPIQYDMADSLQKPPSDRFIIMAFRGAAKSFVTCAFAVWCLWRNPQLKVMIVSASRDRADANAVFIKKIIHTLHFLEHLKARPEQRDSQNIFDVGEALPDISPSIKSVGITGQITGSRADILVSDDVEVPNNSATQVQRDKLNEAVKEYDAILKPGGQIIYLGTPQCEASLYNELQKRGYVARIWPLLFPEDDRRRSNYGNALAPMIAEPFDANPSAHYGLTTEPSRFDMEEVAKRRLSYGAAGFALQFMLDTSLSDAEKYPLKMADLIVTALDRDSTSLTWQWASDASTRLSTVPCIGMRGDCINAPFARSKEVSNFTGGVLAIDPSGRGADETAYAVVKYLNGYLFVMEVGGIPGGYSDSALQALANKAKFWKVTNVLIESNFGDGMFTQLIRPVMTKIHPCAIDEVRSTTMKEARIIDTLEPVMGSHKLIFHQAVIEDDFQVYQRSQAYSLFYQMTRICKEKGALAHDDRLDALAMAVKFWWDYMAVDADKGVESRYDDWLMAQIDKPEVVSYELDLNGSILLMTDIDDGSNLTFF